MLQNLLNDFKKNLEPEIKKLRDKIFTKNFSEIENYFRELLKKFKIDSLADSKLLIKSEWNLDISEEINEYCLNDAIKWFKENHPGNLHTACIFKIEDYKKQKITLHHFFINNNSNEPVLDGSLPYKVVGAQKINDDLKSLFDNKNLLMIK